MADSGWISMEVLEAKRETPLLFNLKLVPALEGAQFDFRVGQYVKMAAPGGRESYFAMTSEPEEKRYVEFLIKDEEGKAAHDLCRLRAHDRVKVTPPIGCGYPIDEFRGKHLYLIAMGSGLAPLRSVLKSVLRKPNDFCKVTLLFGVRTPENIPYQNDFGSWKNKIEYRIAFSRLASPDPAWPSFLGRVTQLIPQLSFSPSEAVACVCGSKEMEEEVTVLLTNAGINRQNIHFNF